MEARRATLDDAEDFAAVVAAVASEGRWIATEPPVDVESFAERVAGTIAKGADVLWVLEDEGRVIGTMGLHGARAPGVMSLGMCIVEGERASSGANEGGGSWPIHEVGRNADFFDPKAARLLNTCRISQSKTVGGLSDRQRHELIALFNHR